MSRIGRKPIVIPAGVEVTINGSDVTVKGPKGTLNSTFHPMIKIEKQGEEVIVTRPNDEKEARSLHGLTRTLISNMVEVKSRGAYLMGLTSYGNYSIEDTVDFTVYIPKTDEHFATSLAVVPLQLMGYYVSVAKGLDVDKPRNLAKSVTVE